MNSRTYEVGRSKIKLIFGDITTSKAEVLVSSDDYWLSMGGGVSAAIRKAGGSRVAADASKMVPARVADVLISTGGDLPAKHILHAITIGPPNLELPADAIVRLTTQRVMQLLPLLNCTSAAFPAIGAGVAGIPHEVVASEMAAALVSALLDNEKQYEIELYLLDRHRNMQKEDFFVFFEAFAARKLGVSTSNISAKHSLEPPATKSPSMDSGHAADAERRHEIYTMLRHLDARRNQVEAELLHALTSEETNELPLSKLREQLSEIQTLRYSYEAQLDPQMARPAVIPNSVFVSSTSVDLKPHRQALRDVIGALRLRYVGMEEFSPSAQAPVDLIRRKVAEGQIYLGVLGMRYGYVDPGTGLSMTELEYRQAIASEKRICMFVMDQNAPILASMVEDDSTRFAKLLDFRSRVMKAHVCGLFCEPSDLASKAEAALRNPE